MKDTYLGLVNGPLKQVAKTLGLPQPVELHRFDSTPADYHRKPVLVLGSGPEAQKLADLLLDNGLEVRRHASSGSPCERSSPSSMTRQPPQTCLRPCLRSERHCDHWPAAVGSSQSQQPPSLSSRARSSRQRLRESPA